MILEVDYLLIVSSKKKSKKMASSSSHHDMIYLDYNATTPLDPNAITAMTNSMKEFGNPSSGHLIGQVAKKGYELNRSQIGKLINAADENEIVILSGGTETINYCLRGAALAAREITGGKGNHIITSKVEHVAVLETFKYLESIGFEATYLSVDSFGRVSPEDVASAIKPSTILCSIMHSNNEVGSINPIKDIAAVLRSKSDQATRILFHSDTSQSLGKVNVDVQDLGIDYATITGHKLYAPKGS
jgi:cysteine desulfurase